MTIVAGFCCLNGIIIASDSEETAGSVKVSKQKMQIRTNQPETVRVVFAGSGDAVFTDMVADELWDRIESAAATVPDILAALKDQLIKIHDKYYKFSNTQVQYETDILIGIWVKDQRQPRLFHAQGPAISEVVEYTCLGAGYELGNYICARMFPQNLRIEEGKLVAIYLLDQVKQFSSFCGGRSRIVCIGLQGPVEVQAWLEGDVRRFFDRFESLVSYAMLKFANAQSSEKDLVKAEYLITNAVPQWKEWHIELVNYTARREIAETLRKGPTTDVIGPSAE